MDVGGRHFRTIWVKPDDEGVVQLIDQRFLPYRFIIEEVHNVEQMATAIREIHVRGAGLIGVSAAFGMYLAAIEGATRPAVSGFDERVARAAEQLKATRPTAVNLSWAIERQLRSMADGKTAKEKGGSRSAHSQFDRGRRCGALPDDRATRVEADSRHRSKESG